MRFLLLCATVLAACASAEAVDESESRSSAIGTVQVKRMCVQQGLQGIGGGSIVLPTGATRGSEIEVVSFVRTKEAVTTNTLFIPKKSATSGLDTLCEIRTHAMQICEGATNVSVHSSPDRSTTAVGTLDPGTPLQLWDFIVGAGGETLGVVDVAIDGQKAGVRYVLADALCSAKTLEPVSAATTALAMNQDNSLTLPEKIDTSPKVFRPRDPSAIERIVIHNTEIPLDATLRVFTRETAATSAHVVVDRTGTIHRIVEDHYVAFHAGTAQKLGSWNAASLGIEVVAGPTEPGWTPEQESAVKKLIASWRKTYGIKLTADVLGNASSKPGYEDREYGRAGVTVHRFSKASKGPKLEDRLTDCPKFIWDNTREGDDQFFAWRKAYEAGTDR